MGGVCSQREVEKVLLPCSQDEGHRDTDETPSALLQLCLPSIQYVERCRLVRSGTKSFDDHCLPSTISGEMEELIDMARMDAFLVYLQCWELCESYGIPLTEDILMRGRRLL